MLEKEKARIEEFCNENGLSLSMVNEKVREMYNKITEEELKKPENERLSERKRSIRAYKRTRFGLKNQARFLKQSVNGMIVCRYPDNDYIRSRYKQCMRAINEDKEAAIAKGFCDENGTLLDNGGKPLDLDNKKPYGKAAGFIMEEDKDGDLHPVPKYIRIEPDISEENIPVCQIGKIALNEGTKPKKEANFRFSNDNTLWYKAGTISDNYKIPYGAEDLNMILGYFVEAFDSDDFRVEKIKNFEELEAFERDFVSKERRDVHSFDFCFAPMSVVQITKKTNYDNAIITLGLIEDTNYPQTITVFLPLEVLSGLKIEEGMDGIAVLQKNDYGKKSNPQWHLGGFVPVDDEVDVAAFFG